MGMLHNIDKWSATHHPRWLVFPRVALGILLIVKGISFMIDTVRLESLLTETNIIIDSGWLPLLITSLHLLCGFLLILGLFTRVACFIMIPFLLGAVLIVNAPGSNFASSNELLTSVLAFLLLLFFLIEGGGPVSLDSFLKDNPR